ncbi:hypothetical protein IV203_029611 [Nitzschia inconspicua]|uniref:Uncharacterized protein n=1 Tax=Nitzschia inconspicua TaxID=303405 RepID=A0A9K3Q158_9STRA|nr:hypothetical protein IV203_029611 [Nitzschia inconspicua]
MTTNRKGALSTPGNATTMAGDDKKNNDDDDLTNIIMGGSVRGILLFLSKKLSLKLVLKRKAFLTIGGTAEGGLDDNALRKKSVSSLSHSRPVVYAETSMMGVVVFGTYNLTLNYLERQKEYSIGETPLIIHAGAGVAAGVARSMFWMAWERAFHQSNWVLTHPKFCIRTTVHHGCGYGTLFGSYQGIRQLLVYTDPLSMCDGAFALLDGGDETEYSSSMEYSRQRASFVPFVYTFMSGGLAGQIHHVLNHYTSHWRQFWKQIPPLPRFHPTLSSFGTMALCFAAFEHGPQAVDDAIESINELIESLERERT